MTAHEFGLHRSWAPVVALISTYDAFFQQRMEEIIGLRSRSMAYLDGLSPRRSDEEFRYLEERIAKAGFSLDRFERFMENLMTEVFRLVGLSLSDALERRFLILPQIPMKLFRETYFGKDGHWNEQMPSLLPLVWALSKEVNGRSLSEASLGFVTSLLRDSLSDKQVSIGMDYSLTIDHVVLYETESGHIAALSLKVIRALLAYISYLSGQPLDYHVMASDEEIEAFVNQDFWKDPEPLLLRGLPGGTLTSLCNGAVVLHFPSTFDCRHVERHSGKRVKDGLQVLERFFPSDY